MEDRVSILKNLFNLSSSFVFGVKDNDDEIIYMNPACEQEFSKDLEDKNIRKFFADWPFEKETLISSNVLGRNLVFSVRDFSGISVVIAEKKQVIRLPDAAFQSISSALTAMRIIIDKIYPLCVEDEKSDLYMSLLYKNYFKLQKNYDNAFLASNLNNENCTLDFEHVEIGTFISDIVSAFEHLLDDRGINIEYEKADEVMTVKMDTKLIEKMILIIIANSVSNTPSGGTVKIRISKQNSTVVITVTDTGEGIEPYILASIFSLSSDEDTEKMPETQRGMGLYIASKIASLHDGAIMINNRSDGGVSTRIMLRISEGGGNRIILKSPRAKYGNSILNMMLAELSDVISTEKYGKLLKKE